MKIWIPVALVIAVVLGDLAYAMWISPSCGPSFSIAHALKLVGC